MASLNPVNWEAVTPELRELLYFIGERAFVERFYLAGGTALALRLGHRRSVDLDFFSSVDEVSRATRLEILNALAPLGALALEDTMGNLLLEVRGIHVGFFSYSYPLLEPTEDVAGVALAGLKDVGLMKLDALISRGARKDFYDLYWITRHVPLTDLLEMGREKYPYARDFEWMAVEGLVYFDNADRDVQPVLLVDVPWEEVKAFFRAEARRLGELWLKPEKEEGQEGNEEQSS
jgi:hypothetical protein